MKRLHTLLVFMLCGYSLCPAQSPDNAPPDAIYINGHVLAVDPAFGTYQAFAVKADHFAAVGTNASIAALAGPKTIRVDLQGRTVIPGLIDGHNHQYRAATLLRRGVDVVDVPSLAELLSRIHVAALKAKPGETVYTSAGWDYKAFPEKRVPNKAELDEVGAGHAVVVQTTRGNVYMNSLALKELDITRDTKDFSGFPVIKNKDGEPTGWLTAPVGPFLPQSLQVATAKIIPTPTMEEKMQLIEHEQHLQNALGITSLRELWLTPEAIHVYQQLYRQHRMTIRVSMGITAFGSTKPAELEETLKTWGVGSFFGDHWLRLDDVGELQVDGSVEDSYLREPFTKPANKGTGTMLINATPANLTRLISLIDQYDWRPSTHIWGDRGLDVTLDAYEAAVAAQGPVNDKRWTVEHVLLIHPDQVERMKKMSILVSAQAQPYWEASIMREYWGDKRADSAEPLRMLLDKGIIVGSGSDWPSLPNNPFVNFYFYVTRDSQKWGRIGLDQKITRPEALRLATINNAYITNEEKVKGSIEPGKLADFLILSADIMTVPDKEIPAIHPLATFVDGKKVYTSGESSF
jgi:predicted amidohydrolase YtcJ